MPNIEVPAIPIPVQTAYDIDSGIFFMANDKNIKLAILKTTVTMLGISFENPFVNFKPVAHEISRSPANIKYNQLFKLNTPKKLSTSALYLQRPNGKE